MTSKPPIAYDFAPTPMGRTGPVNIHPEMKTMSIRQLIYSVGLCLSVALTSCKNPKAKPLPAYKEPPAVIHINLATDSFSVHDTIRLPYTICNPTPSAYTYMPDDYIIEHYHQGKWQRLDNDFGSTLMEKEIAPHTTIKAQTILSLQCGHPTTGLYRITNTFFRNGLHTDSTRTIATSDCFSVY